MLSLGLGLVALGDPGLAKVLLAGRPRSVVLPLVALWIYVIARVPSTLDPPAALGQVLERTALGTVIVILASGVIGDGRRAVIRAGLLGMAVVAVWGIAQRAGVHPFLDPSIWRPSRPTRPLGTHNLMGVYLATWLPVGAAVALAATGWRKVGWGAVALLGLACLLLSESRGAWLALAVALVAMGPWLMRGGTGHVAAAWRRDRRGAWILVLAALIVTAACAGSVVARLGTPESSGLLAGDAPAGDRFERAPARAEPVGRAEPSGHADGASRAEPAGAKALTSFERRALVARTAIALVEERPLGGYGPGSFRLAFYTARPPLMQRLEAETGETAVHAHSDPLEIAAEYGLVGLLLVVVWLGLAAWRAFGAIDPRPGIGPGGGSARARARAAADALVEAGLVAGGMTLGIHAVVDFPLHEAPTALIGAVFLGLAAGERVAPPVVRPGRRPGVLLAMRLGAGALLIAGIAGAVAVAVSDRAYRRAYAVLSSGDLAGSERWLERARRWAPDQARDWVAWGEVARHEARLATSAAERTTALEASAVRFGEAARREPQIASRWFRAATSLDEARAAGAAVSVDSVRAFLDRALALNPYLGRARARRVALAREERDWAKVTAVLAAGDSVSPGDPGLALERGRLLGLRGEAGGALVEFERVARGSNREAAGMALDEIAALARVAGERVATGAAPPVADPVGRLELLAHDEGLDLAVRAGAARLRGDVAVASGDLDGARAWYAEAATASPGSPEVELGLGNVAYASGDLAEAGRRYRSALGGRPEMAEAWQNLGHVALASGDTAGALRSYGRALAQQPANAALRAYVEQITGQSGEEGQR